MNHGSKVSTSSAPDNPPKLVTRNNCKMAPHIIDNRGILHIREWFFAGEGINSGSKEEGLHRCDFRYKDRSDLGK